MRHLTWRFRNRAIAITSILLPSLAGLPLTFGTSTLLVMAATGQAIAETVCFKTNTELDFINKTDMQNSRDKLENTNYFGPGGAAAPETFDFSAISTVTEAALAGAGCDIFIGGGFEGSLSTTEGTQLVNWVQGRNVMVIGGCDLDTDNQTCLAFGRTLTDIPNGGVQLDQTLAYNPLTCGGADAVATFGGRSTYPGLGPSGTDVTLAQHNTALRESAVTTDSLTNPSLLMTADADMFGSSGSTSIGAGPIASSNQAIFLINVFKFALDGLNGRLSNPQCVDSYENRTDLEIALSTPAGPVSFGDTIILTVQVANVAGFSADDVAASVTIPSGFRPVSASGVGSYDPDTGIWSISTLAVGQSETLEVTLEAIAPGSSNFFAEISNSSLTDPDSAPNSSFADDDLNDGLSDDDEATASITVLDVDRSDAPIGGEAVHEITAGIFLGAGVPDNDTPGQSDASATGDDLDGNNDDDGVTLPALVPGEVGTITVSATGAGGYLQAWIDFDGNGVFDGNEQIATDMADLDGDGTLSIPVAVPAGATTAQTFARFRWSRDFSIGPQGFAGDGEVEDYAVTLGTAGPTLSGRVFIDNGAGGGIAHDGLVSGTEVGISDATITIRDAGGTVIATPAVSANGVWYYGLPSSHAGSVSVSVSSDALVIVNEQTGGLPGLTNTEPRDGTFSFTPAPGQSYGTLDIGTVEPPKLADDNTAVVSPGQTTNLRHRYRATTAGDVTFTYVDPLVAPANSFSAALFIDDQCDGTPNTAVGGAISVTEGQIICIVSRIATSSGAPAGGRITYALNARTVLSGIAFVLDAKDFDDVTVGSNGEVILSKMVRNITTGTADSTTNIGDLGDILEYRIIVRNLGSDTASAIVVQDTTPAYTRLSEAIPTPVILTPDVTCNVSTPASNVAGYAGPIRWDCNGALKPGSNGAISFRVQIEP